VPDDLEGATAPDPAADPAAAGTPTLAALDSKIDRLAAVVERIAGGAHAGSQDAVEARLDSPGRIAAVVRDELTRAGREREAADLAATVQSTAETVAQLAEQPPRAPVRKVTRVMFGRDPE
jgi:hypothetical protein